MTYEQLGRWLYHYYCVSHVKIPKDLVHSDLTYSDGLTGVMGLTEKDIESLNLEFTAFDMQDHSGEQRLYCPRVALSASTKLYTTGHQKLNWWVQTNLPLGAQNKVRAAIRHVKLEQEVINL